MIKQTLTQKLSTIMSPDDARAAKIALEQSWRSAFSLWCCQLFARLIGEAEDKQREVEHHETK